MSRGRRRNRTEIWTQLLESCTQTSRTQTWLLRELGLNTETVKEALEFLEKTKLINKNHEKTNENIQYITTKKGEEALTQYYLLFTEYFVNTDLTFKPPRK